METNTALILLFVVAVAMVIGHWINILLTQFEERTRINMDLED